MFVKFLQPQWGLICIYVSISLTNVPIVNVFCCAIHILLLIAPWNTLLNTYSSDKIEEYRPWEETTNYSGKKKCKPENQKMHYNYVEGKFSDQALDVYSLFVE